MNSEMADTPKLDMEGMLKTTFHGFIEEGADARARLPAIMKRGATIPPRSRGRIVYGGHGRVGPGVCTELSDYSEEQLVGLLVQGGGELDLLSLFVVASARRTFGPIRSVWHAVGLVPSLDLGISWSGKPGDLDLLVGPWRDGRPHFDWLAGCELKRRTTRIDGAPNSPRSSPFFCVNSPGRIIAG
jgi:hypothetical protein